MSERLTRGLITSTYVMMGGILIAGCCIGTLIFMPTIARAQHRFWQSVDSYTKSGTICEELKADLAYEEVVPPLSPREIQQGDGLTDEMETPIPSATLAAPVTSRRISESAGLAHFYGDDVIDCFGEPTYYYAYWQQEPEDRALIAELIYADQGLIFRSYSLSDWQGNAATLHAKTKFGTVQRIPLIENITELAPHLSVAWYEDKPTNPMWVNEAVYEWQGWENIVLPMP